MLPSGVRQQLALAVLAEPASYRAIGEGGGRRVRERYDREVTLPRLAEWLAGVASSRGKGQSVSGGGA